MHIKNAFLLVVSLFVTLGILGCKHTPTDAEVAAKQNAGLADTLALNIDTKTNTVTFKPENKQSELFQTVNANIINVPLHFVFPAAVKAKSYPSDEEREFQSVLFDDPTLTTYYTGYLQNRSLKVLASANFTRVKELFDQRAATIQDLNEASANLYNVESSILDNELKLKQEGLDPLAMRKASANTCWFIVDLPETELRIVNPGEMATLEIPAYPNQIFTAKVEAVANVLNIQTRKIRVRLVINDSKQLFRPGMFARASFNLKERGMMLPKTALISVNARYYMFVKTAAKSFQYREVLTSSESGDLIEIAGGIKPGESVVINHTYLLKGIFFGI